MKKKCLYIVVTMAIVICCVGIGYKYTKMNEVKNAVVENREKYVSGFNDSYNVETTDYKDVLELEKDYAFVGQLDNGRAWIPSRITDEGILYGSTQHYGRNGKVDFISYDLNTGNHNVISSNSDGLSIVFTEYNDDYVFYVEENISYETRINLYNRKTGDIKEIARNIPLYSDNSSIAIGDEFVLWVDYKDSTPIIRKYSMVTEEYSIYKENAISPAICDDFIAYLGPDENDDSKIALFINYFENNETKQLISNLKITEIKGSGNLLAVAYSEDSCKKVAILENGVLKDVLVGESILYDFNFLQISDNFVTWNSISQSLVYDINSGQVLLIDGEDESQITIISNNYIINTGPRKTLPNGKEQTDAIANKTRMYMGDIYVKKLK